MEFLNSQTELFNESKSNIQIKNNLKASTNIENNDMSYSIDLSTKIGSGAFGDIYKVTCTTTNVVYAVKIETVVSSNNKSSTEYEAKILKYLKGGIGIPRLIEFISTKENNYLIFDLLGINLDELFLRCKKHFSINTIKYLTSQMIGRIEFLHLKKLIHRDIKPENFTLSGNQNNNPSQIYLIDFGLTKKYVDKHNTHIAIKEGIPLIGTARYASINTHLGYQQSRRDDLESFLYCILYFMKGSLPWQHLRVKSKQEKYQKILEIKISICDNEIGSYPKSFVRALQYVRNLQFEEKPDYSFIKHSIFSIDKDNNNIDESALDWIANKIDINSYYNSKQEKK